MMQHLWLVLVAAKNGKKERKNPSRDYRDTFPQRNEAGFVWLYEITEFIVVLIGLENSKKKQLLR